MARLRRFILCTTLVLVTAWAHPGGAAADMFSGAAKSAFQRQATVRGEAAIAAERPVHLPIGGALALAEPFLRAAVIEGDATRLPLVRSGAAAQAKRGLLAHRGVDGLADTGLSYPVSATMSLGLGYSYVTTEDLAFAFAGTGSLEPNYDSHSLLIRALWQF